LSALATNAGTISFNAATKTYNLNVANAVTSATVTATATQAGQTMTLRGVALVSGTACAAVDLIAGVNKLIVRVISANGEFEGRYTINITRAAE
jgi:hypothetical protein